MATCMSRLVSTDTKSTDSMMQLNQSMQAGLNRMHEAYQTLSTKFASTQNEAQAQAVSQVEMEKLQKRLAQIETDLVDKDKQLLDNETQLLTLTEQVEAYQQIEAKLKQLVAELEQKEITAEERKTAMLQDLKERNATIEQLESLKSQADEEIVKLQDLLKEADEQLTHVEQRFSQVEQENQAMQQRYEQNELLVASVKKDFQQILNYKNDLEVLIEEQTQSLESKNQRLFQVEE